MNIIKIGNKELHISDSKIHWKSKILEYVIEQPTEIRYGTLPIEFDMFKIGTNHRIELRNTKKDKLIISIKSYFGIGKNRKFRFYQQVADIIWDNFFAESFGKMVDDWKNGQTISIGKYDIDQNGLTRKVGPRGITMNFDEIQLLPRYDHLLINSKIRVDKYMKLMYLEDWNWPLIHEILCQKKGMPMPVITTRTDSKDG